MVSHCGRLALELYLSSKPDCCWSDWCYYRVARFLKRYSHRFALRLLVVELNLSCCVLYRIKCTQTVWREDSYSLSGHLKKVHDTFINCWWGKLMEVVLWSVVVGGLLVKPKIAFRRTSSLERKRIKKEKKYFFWDFLQELSFSLNFFFSGN